MIRSKSVLAAIAVAIAAIGLGLAPGTAAAHSTGGVPYHTKPAASMFLHDAGGSCWLYYSNPTVYGFTHEYVYWRLMTATPDGRGGYKYAYSEYRRAEAWSNGSDYATWYGSGYPSTDPYGYEALGAQLITVTPGQDRWIGYQIYYGSNRQTHGEWLIHGGC